MGLLSPILRNVMGGGLSWWCPACDRAHSVSVRPGGWTWSGDASRPTFNPSVMVTYDGSDAGQGDAPPAICHSFVREGQMHFLNDCTHGMVGRVVPIPPWPTPGDA